MYDESIASEQWDVQKKTLAIMAEQQQQIGMLFDCYHRLMEFMRSEAGMEGRSPEQTKSEESQKRLQAGIAELEAMFRDDEEAHNAH